MRGEEAGRQCEREEEERQEVCFFRAFPGFYSRAASCAQRLPRGEEAHSLALHILSLSALQLPINLPVSGHDA
jgi:hypothetical protein